MELHRALDFLGLPRWRCIPKDARHWGTSFSSKIRVCRVLKLGGHRILNCGKPGNTVLGILGRLLDSAKSYKANPDALIVFLLELEMSLYPSPLVTPTAFSV